MQIYDCGLWISNFHFIFHDAIDEIVEDKDFDSTVASAIAEIELELEDSRKVQQIMVLSKEHIDELNRQLLSAKQESDAAQTELDSLQLAETKAIAELEVARTEKERIEMAMADLSPTVDKLQEEVKQVKAELQEATAKLGEIKEVKQQRQLEADKARHALQATVSLQTKIIAETETAKKNATRYERQTGKIRSQLDDLNARLDAAKELAKNSSDELRSARITEAKLENELSLYQKRSRHDSEHELFQSQIQAQEDSESDVSQPRPEVDDSEITDPKRDARVPETEPETNSKEAKDDDKNTRVNTIYNLYDAGYSIDDISKATNIAQGQVELFIKMRTFKLNV